MASTKSYATAQAVSTERGKCTSGISGRGRGRPGATRVRSADFCPSRLRPDPASFTGAAAAVWSRPERTGVSDLKHVSVDQIQTFAIIAPVLLFSMVAHEYAHGYAALKQGDPTAQQLGRLTWNPLKHIDPFLTIILPMMTFFLGNFIFGGAKPVPVSPQNYREYRRGDIIVSLAGVATNAVLVVLLALLIIPVGMLGQSMPGAFRVASLVQEMLRWGIIFNLILVFFNLLPIPPLDGSHVVKHLLPPAWQIRYVDFGRYGLLVLVGLLTIGRDILTAWLAPMWAILRMVLSMVSPYLLPSVLS